MMRHLIKTNTLATVIAITLVSAAWQTPAQAGNFIAAAPAATDANLPANGVEVYIVEFDEPGLVNHKDNSFGVAATAPSATGKRKLDMQSRAAVDYSALLESRRANYLLDINAALGRSGGQGLAVTHTYSVTMNGLAAEMSAAEAAKVALVPGVKSVRPAGVEYLNTYRGPKFIGAGSIWDGSATPTLTGHLGKGIKAGVLDGGANSAHPSFANDPACGFSERAPKLLARDCSSSSGGICNGPNPEANPGFGHGVHTASTVAGNTIDNTVTPAPELPNGMTMSGVAPCAAIFQYKVCATNSCGGADIVAGINNAIADGVDVINFSISGGTNPWSDNDRNFLDAVNADVFVAASAGNTNTTITNPVGQVNHRGPWVMTVAASTQDQIVGPNLSAVGPGTPPVGATGIPLNPGSTTASTPTLTGQMIKASSTNLEGCTASGAFPANFFASSIAVVRRGTCPFTEKITNAYTAGAVAVVIANNQVGSISMDTTGAPSVPAYSIIQSQGDALISFINANPTNATANLVPIAQGNTQPDVIADFSFRGPTPGTLADLTKPDITAPGVNIYAATDPTSGNYEFMSGTSMSGPHTAGAAALVRAVRPEWSVSEVKSAMQSTAKIDGFMENGTTPWTIDIVGSGRVDLTKAALAGLTLNETYARFLAANPSGGSINVKDLNLASVRNMNCTPTCTFTRTVTNRLAMPGSWSTSFQSDIGNIIASVSPANFTLAPGESKVLTITVSPPYETAMTAIGFGNLFFTEAGGHSPQQHFSVAIKGTGGMPPVVEDLIFADGFDGEEVAPAPVVMALDDGTAESAIVWSDAGVQSPSIWLNRFSPGAGNFPMNLVNVQILWPSPLAGASPVGKAVRVLVYLDQDADGNPSNAVLVGQSDVSIGQLDSYQTYPMALNLPTAGDLYIGFIDTFAEGGTTPEFHVAGLDTNTVIGRSWVSANDVGSPNTTDLSANDYLDVLDVLTEGSIVGTWTIRANGTTTAGRPVQLN